MSPFAVGTALRRGLQRAPAQTPGQASRRQVARFFVAPIVLLATVMAPTSSGAGATATAGTSCGAAFIGPVLEQAVNITAHGVGCQTAKRVAVASRGHLQRKVTRAGYTAAGFRCRGSRSKKRALHYRCASGARVIAFDVG